jgi:hypothetical protein
VLSGAARLMSYTVLGPGVPGPPVTNTIPQTGDGMTLDTQGNLYLCQPAANQILVRSPAGATLGSITFPEAPANCTFGGKDMKTLFVTARTSLYVCRMAAEGHRFAWNPNSYEDFQTKFFGATNAATADPDGDGANNELEYLTFTHPLCPGDAWRISIQRNGTNVQLSFPAWHERGYIIERSGVLSGAGGWQNANLPFTISGASRLPQTATGTDTVAPGENRFYRVQVFPSPQ